MASYELGIQEELGHDTESPKPCGRLDFYKTATAEDAGANNIIEFHDYSLESRHVQRSLEMSHRGGPFDVRVFKQVPDLDVDADDFDVKEAFVEIKYKRGKNGVWVEE